MEATTNDIEFIIEQLRTFSEEQVHTFIRERLAFKDNIASQIRDIDKEEFEKRQHRRFEMSGYENKTGECTLHNLAIVNEFADLGIYDYTDYLFLDFYKGHGTLYLCYFQDNEHLKFEFGGYRTVEIIHEIFKHTILSDRRSRRRI